MDFTVRPTEVGQSVRFIGYGGNVRQWHADVTDCVVSGFTRAGNPIILLSGSHVQAQTGKLSILVTDTYGVARRIDSAGRWVRPQRKDP